MSQLGHFEQELLTELRQEVTARADLPSPRRRLPGGRVALATAGGGLLAAGLVIGLPGVDGGQGSEAYAVTPNDDGTVTISVAFREDADGLERELAEHGITAVIDYPPDGMACKQVPRRYEPGVADGETAPFVTAFDGRSDYGWTLIVEPAKFGDRTLVIENDVHPVSDVHPESMVEKPVRILGWRADLAIGPVAPCDAVPIADGTPPGY